MLWLALCGVAAYVAGNKGRSGFGIFFLSFFLSPLVGIIVALVMNPNPAAQGKKRCPSCAEFVQRDARICRFCQHSFVEEEAAERARLEEERIRLAAEQAAAKARQQAEYEARQAAEAAKPWLRRNTGGLAMLFLVASVVTGLIWYGIAHPVQPAPEESASLSHDTTVPDVLTPAGCTATGMVWRDGGCHSSDDWESPSSSTDAMGTTHETIRATSVGHSLVIRCTGRRLEAYIISDRVVDSDSDGDASVRLKYDNDKPVSEIWSRSSDDTALFSPNPLRFVQNLVNTKVFAFEYEPFQLSSRVVTFRTKNMPQALSCLQFSKPDTRGDIKVSLAASTSKKTVEPIIVRGN